MRTSIVETASVEGSGKAAAGWFELTTAVLSYDHPHHAWCEEAISIDFLNSALGPEARVGVELLESARALPAVLSKAIAAASALSRGTAWPIP